MTRAEVLNLFPNATESVIAANLGGSKLPEQEGGAGKEERLPAADSPELERCAPTSTVGKTRKKGADSQGFLVRVTSVRRRLIDEDNLCEKYAVDCCRYAGLLPSDCPGETKIEATQRKAGKEEAEHTVIQIFALDYARSQSKQ